MCDVRRSDVDGVEIGVEHVAVVVEAEWNGVLVRKLSRRGCAARGDGRDLRLVDEAEVGRNLLRNLSRADDAPPDPVSRASGCRSRAG
jgi:hypothetical protein